jgi:hypothetical protein
MARITALLLALTAGVAGCACAAGPASCVRRDVVAAQTTTSDEGPSLDTLGWTLGSQVVDTL